MKLSEILKDWPKDNYYSHGSLSELPMDEARSAFSEGYSTALTSCDREIDREALAKAINSTYKIGMVNKWNIDWDWSVDIADRIISTMPTWLKRSEE